MNQKPKTLQSGGGWQAIRYTWNKAKQAGGIFKLWKALRTKNVCKTCALGMGGQKGGMVNEIGGFPEVCKKSLQAMVADMQGAISTEFFQKYSIEQLKSFSPKDLEHCGRLANPLLWTPSQTHYHPITWEDAYERIVRKLKSIVPDESFWYFSGRSSNEAGFLLQLFARLYGTNNVNNCSFYCHQASGVGLTSVIGSGTATVVLDDLEKADCVFVIGGNPPSNHPRLMNSLKRVKRRKGKVIVINPVVETGLVNFRVPSDPISLLFGTPIADLYVQPHIGGDMALLYGVAKRVVEKGKHNLDFLVDHCVNWKDYLDVVSALTWNEIEQKSGVPKDEISQIADIYCESEKAIFSWTMGITHHEHGVQNVEAIANLALLRGMVGKPHTGLMPIRGHSNVQGIGSVGVTPKLKEAIYDNLKDNYKLELPLSDGKDTLACMEAAYSGEVKLGFCLGGNLYGSNPDSTFAAKALSKLEQIVYLSTTLNTGHMHALGQETIILPVKARDEESQKTTQESMFNFVRLSDGGPARLNGPRSEIEIIASIAHQTLETSGPIVWKDMNNTNKIREMIARVVPGFEQIKEIDRTRKEFQIGGRTFHRPLFATDSGKANMKIHLLPHLKGNENQLRLMTVRSEGQFNSVVYEEEDIYRNQTRRDVILMHPEDLTRFSIPYDSTVTVSNETGKMQNIIAKSFDRIKPGNALMYFPEANVLVPKNADPRSKTPVFKGVIITVTPSQNELPVI